MKLKELIRKEILSIIKENSAAKLYKVEGKLISSDELKTQSQILSDIRSITGITTVNVEEYTPKMPKKGRFYDILTIKIDPYPYIRHGKFDLDTIKQIIDNINHVKGVIKFTVDNPQMINIGI